MSTLPTLLIGYGTPYLFLLISESSFLGEIDEEKWEISKCRYSWKMAVKKKEFTSAVINCLMGVLQSL